MIFRHTKISLAQISEQPPLMLCQVESYSGSRLHERPRRFTWKESWLEIDQVIEQWVTPVSYGFKVRVGDRVFRLEHHQAREAWEVEIISAR